MHCIVTDEDFLDKEGNPRQDANIYEQFCLCHPSIAEKVQHGCKQLMGIDLEIMTKDEWEEKNISSIGKG